MQLNASRSSLLARPHQHVGRGTQSCIGGSILLDDFRASKAINRRNTKISRFLWKVARRWRSRRKPDTVDCNWLGGATGRDPGPVKEEINITEEY